MEYARYKNILVFFLLGYGFGMQAAESLDVTRSGCCKKGKTFCSLVVGGLTTNVLAVNGPVRFGSNLLVRRDATVGGNLMVSTPPVDANGTPIAQGPVGPVGPPGPTILAEGYAYVYSLVAQDVAVGDALSFELDAGLSDITHPNNTDIVVGSDGIYGITFFVSIGTSGANPQCTLFSGATPLASTVYGVNQVGAQLAGHALKRLTAGAILTLKNNTATGNIVLSNTGTGVTQTGVSTSILIVRLA